MYLIVFYFRLIKFELTTKINYTDFMPKCENQKLDFNASLTQPHRFGGLNVRWKKHPIR